jgi:hypothetical protein
MDIWALAIPAIVGAVAWIYQKTAERQERRMKQYEETIDELPAFQTAGLNPDRIDKIFAVHRRLWIHGPDNVVRAFDAFIASVEPPPKATEVRELMLGKLVLAMRKDAGFVSALIPRLRTTLKPEEFKLKTVNRDLTKTLNQ